MSSLRKKSGKALAWDLIGNYGGQATTFIISIFLARLLEPDEFGMVAMSLVLIIILRVFMDFGLTSALIQHKENSSLTYSSVFYINILTGLVLTVTIFLSAPLVGKFYKNEEITTLVKFLSITFIISSLTLVQGSILQRNMNFKKLTIRDLTAQVSAGIIAIVCAYKGFGVYALVIQHILAGVVRSALLWRISAWQPKLEFSWPEVRKLTGFSFYVFAERSLGQVIRQFDALFVGKLFSAATLGFFTRANSLNGLITRNSITSISRVFFPVLSSLQDDDKNFSFVYLKVLKIVSVLSFFLTGLFFIIGESVIIMLFGEKWEPSVPVFEILIIKGFTYPISAMIVTAFLAKGKSKENFHYGNIRKILQLVPFVFAYLYGFYEFLYALVGIAILLWVMNNLVVCHTLRIGIRDQFMTSIPSLLITVFLVTSIELFFPGKGFLLTALKGVCFSAAYILISMVTDRELFREMKIIVQFIRNKRASVIKAFTGE